MAQFLEQLGSFIEQIIQTIGYPGIAVMMVLENVIPPIPSELIMPFSGFLVARGEFNFIGVWVAGIVGSVGGALVLYYFGMWAGDTVVRGFLRRYGRLLGVSEEKYDRALQSFDRYGDAIIFIGRVIPLIRSIISIPAGANHMPMPKFILFTTLGSAIWSGALTYAGMMLGEHWAGVIGLVESYQSVISVAFIGLLLLYGVRYTSRMFARSRAASLKIEIDILEQ